MRKCHKISIFFTKFITNQFWEKLEYFNIFENVNMFYEIHSTIFSHLTFKNYEKRDELHEVKRKWGYRYEKKRNGQEGGERDEGEEKGRKRGEGVSLRIKEKKEEGD